MLPYPDIDPVAVQLGPVQVHWYGISYVVGLLIAWWLLVRRAAAPGSDWNAEEIADLIFYSAVGMIIGGRLGSVLFYNFPYYAEHPLHIIRIWEGGMSFHGGLIGVIGAMYVFARRRGRYFFAVSDYLAPVVPVGLFCGRLGNFINGELWGKPSDLPWAMIFPAAQAGGIPRHPTQLYEALLEGVVLFTILWWFSARPRPRMAVSGLFLGGYGVFRLLVEFVRAPDSQLGYLAWGWLTMGQLLSLPMLILGLWFLYLAYRSNEATAG